MESTAEHIPFHFGPSQHETSATEAFWALHAPVVRSWVEQMQAADDPWWDSARFAADCLVSYRTVVADERDEDPDWRDFDVEEFLFVDLEQGGTVGFYGSVPIFFDQLVQSMQLFIDAGIVESSRGTRWVEQMIESKARFLEHYKDCEVDDDEEDDD